MPSAALTAHQRHYLGCCGMPSLVADAEFIGQLYSLGRSKSRTSSCPVDWSVRIFVNLLIFCAGHWLLFMNVICELVAPLGASWPYPSVAVCMESWHSGFAGPGLIIGRTIAHTYSTYNNSLHLNCKWLCLYHVTQKLWKWPAWRLRSQGSCILSWCAYTPRLIDTTTIIGIAMSARDWMVTMATVTECWQCYSWGNDVWLKAQSISVSSRTNAHRWTDMFDRYRLITSRQVTQRSPRFEYREKFCWIIPTYYWLWFFFWNKDNSSTWKYLETEFYPICCARW